MLFKEHFKIGDKIKLGIYKNKDEIDFYESKIADVNTEKNILKIYNINTKDNIISLKKGEKLHITKELGSTIFFFHTNFLFIEKSKFAYLNLDLPLEIEKMQRREFYRLDVNVKVSIKKENTNDCEFYLGITSDLSGNGLSVDLDAVLDLGDVVSINFSLIEDIGVDEIYGKVVRVAKGELLPHRYGIEFIDLELSMKEKIIAYIFQVQRLKIQIAKSMKY